ncbi:DUF6912 family protein [Mobiluncus mulieris]|uniref:DUF6912 family protein n=1 Tax=Mobiluncus mulieris TaxID=2052 RepID=UPI00242C4EAA|nr:hypothetical protein [Mobiluncus mulieris]
MKEGKLHRVYLALNPQELENLEFSGGCATIVDEEFLKANNFPELGGLHGEDQEIAEDTALYQAAARSRHLQSAASEPRLVVAVAETAAELQSRLGEPGEYSLSRPVPLAEVVSFHVSEAVTESDSPEGNTSESEADGLTSAGVELPSLLWFDVSELELVREFLGITPNR